MRDSGNLTGVIVSMLCSNCGKHVWAKLERTDNPAAAPKPGAPNTFAHHLAVCLECDHAAFDHWNWNRNAGS